MQLHKLLVHRQWTGPGRETKDEVWVFGLWLERVDPLGDVLCDLSDHQGSVDILRRPIRSDHLWKTHVVADLGLGVSDSKTHFELGYR